MGFFIFSGHAPFGGGPYDAYAVYDNFTGANGTAIASHTPDRDSVGGGWRQNSGTWTLNASNQLTATSVNQSSVDIDGGVADATIQVTFVTLAGNDAGIIARSTDDSNYYLISANAVGGITGIYKRESGGFTQIGGNYTVAWGNGDTLKVVLSGNSISAYRNDVLIGTQTDATYPTQTKHGIRSHVASSFAADAFSIT